MVALRILTAILLLSACATAPVRKQPAAVQSAPSDAFAMRKPEHISSSNDAKLGELRAVPAAKTTSEPVPRAGRPDPIER
jgi:hypothetical protein